MTIERFATAGAFVIARGPKREVAVVVAEIAEAGAVGRGEGTAVYYRGETAEGVAAAVERVRGMVEAGGGRDELAAVMGPGAARNALDCALWDLEARLTGVPVWKRAGLGEAPAPFVTAVTLSLDEPAAMEAAARRLGRLPLLKLKLGGDERDAERVAAVRRGAPGARLIVDANEAWGGRDVAAEAAAMAELGVELIEQPVPAGADAALARVNSPVPLCADESVHDRAGLEAVRGCYGAINIKLDKAGGLTEALALAAEARTLGLEVMVGCMLGTSFAAAPACLLAPRARWVDLDAPLLLAEDRPGGAAYRNGLMIPPGGGFWGG